MNQLDLNGRNAVVTHAPARQRALAKFRRRRRRDPRLAKAAWIGLLMERRTGLHEYSGARSWALVAALLTLARVSVSSLRNEKSCRNRPPAAENAANFFPSSARAAGQYFRIS